MCFQPPACMSHFLWDLSSPICCGKRAVVLEGSGHTRCVIRALLLLQCAFARPCSGVCQCLAVTLRIFTVSHRSGAACLRPHRSELGIL